VSKDAYYDIEPFKLNVTAALNDTKKTNISDFLVILYVLPKTNDYAP
jgi:hypothetical protein